MATGKALNGKPYAGNPHVLFDEGEVASAATPRRGSLLYRKQTWKAVISAAAIAAGAAIPMAANASSITIDSVTQRWPWNNKVDIKYTIDGGQTLTADGTGDVYCRLEFTATVNGQNVLIDGRAIGANASSGTHTATWTPSPELRVKALDCTMTARLLSADNPSGDDYMVIDLDTGDVTFEGMLYSQGLSNNRYNNDTSGPDGANVYKTSKMVLRKVPRWADRNTLPNATVTLASLSGYPFGWNNLTGSSATNWVTKQDYYIGMFPVTQAQYVKYGLTNPSECTDTIVGNTTDYRPVDGVSYNDLRGETRAGTALPEVDSMGSATFFLQQLNCKTGNKFKFDLPTEVMYEIACRAGSSAKYYWGETADYSTYVVSSTSLSSKRTTTEEVGTKVANDWGLYDMVGNVYEWCLDECDKTTPSTRLLADPFIPYVNSSYTQARVKGIPYNGTSTSYMNPSYRNYGGFTFKTDTGFRVAYIAK